MNRMRRALVRCAMFTLTFAPAVIVLTSMTGARFYLLVIWFAAQTLLMALISLIPGYVGNYREYDRLQQVGLNRGADPNPDRMMEHVLVREGRRFPLRLFCALTLTALLGVAMWMAAPALIPNARMLLRVALTAFCVIAAAGATYAIAASACVFTEFVGIMTGLTLYIVSALYMRYADCPARIMSPMLGGCAAAYLFLAMLTLNYQSISNSMYAYGARRAPKQVTSRNRLIVVCLSALILFVSSINALRNGVVWLFTYLRDALRALAAMLASEPEPAEEIVMEASPGMAGLFPLEEVAETSTSPLADYLVYAFLILIGVAFVWFLISRIILLVKKISRLMRSFARGVGEGFYDEHEDILSMEELRQTLQNRLSGRLRKLLAREPGWEKLTARERARRLVRVLYKRNARRVPSLSRKTAREALKEMALADADRAALTAAYEVARYSEHEVDETEVERLKRAVKP